MEFLITESQLKLILEQEENSRISNDLKSLYSFTVKMVEKVSKAYGLNLKMLLTWGTSVGGFVIPLDNYIKSGEFTMTEDQRMLVLAGVVFILYFEGKRGLPKLLEKLKKQKLDEEFEKVLDKATKLKETFTYFLESLKTSSSVLMETIAYSFLIPIIPDFLEIIRNTDNVKEAANQIVKRIIASGVVLIGREALTSIIRKIVKKLQ